MAKVLSKPKGGMTTKPKREAYAVFTSLYGVILLPYLLLLPSLLFLAVFYAWPLVEAIRTAFTAEGGLGLGNFRSMAADLNFRAALP